MASDVEMSPERFEIAYEGSALRAHTMDVQELAPALLSLGDLIREANAQINENRATVRVMVSSNFEHGCFNVSFEVIQTVFEQIKTLLSASDIKTAKELLEWLDLVYTYASLPVVGSVGLLTFLKIKKGRNVERVLEIRDQQVTGDLKIKFEGDNNTVIVNRNVYKLSENKRVTSAVDGVLAPLEAEGYDELQIRGDGKIRQVISKSDAAEIRQSLVATPESVDEIEHEPQIVTAHLRVHGPVYDVRAPRWRFKFGDRPIYADISDTTIAKDAIARGGSLIGDTYKVRLEITEHETPGHEFNNSYKVLEVLDFTPGPTQLDMLSPPRANDESDGKG